MERDVKIFSVNGPDVELVFETTTYGGNTEEIYTEYDADGKLLVDIIVASRVGEDEIDGDSKVEKISLLHLLIYYANVEAVEWLLEQGANITQKDEAGNGVLHYAAMFSKEDMFEVLGVYLEKANESIKNIVNMPTQSETPLNIAVFARNTMAVKYLIGHGADPTLRIGRNKVSAFKLEVFKGLSAEIFDALFSAKNQLGNNFTESIQQNSDTMRLLVDCAVHLRSFEALGWLVDNFGKQPCLLNEEMQQTFLANVGVAGLSVHNEKELCLNILRIIANNTNEQSSAQGGEFGGFGGGGGEGAPKDETVDDALLLTGADSDCV